MRNFARALIAALSLTAVPVLSQAGLFIGVSVGLPPPALPVYVQPPCPAAGYIWIPGYWAWDEDYYWVPGTWVLAPEPGLLWTPGYWGWSEGAYLWHAGYWGPQVGFYGGINYGFGYTGVGYEGGYWRGSEFYYNRSVTNISTTNITNVYNRTVINNVNVTRVSFNGGAGGVSARPTPAQLSAEHERRIGETPMQRQQEQLAHADNGLRAAVNGGHPPIAATPSAGAFSGHGVVAAHGAEAGSSRFDRPPGGGERVSAPSHTIEHMSPPARTAEHITPPAHTAERMSPPQYAARSGDHPNGSANPYEGRAYQPHPEAQPHAQPQFGARPAPQYPAARPAPQYQPHMQPPPPQHPQPQVFSQPPRPAPQPAAHGGQPALGQQAARPEHGGEHNRQS
ncbi:MAG: YXWGXW repeat-containing protein [Gammaproteobacteria bacterium]|nr:YXWGXW repeat-containing protein [Gammaproteobacteria bacterium]